MGSVRASVLGAGVRGDRACRREAGGDFGRRRGSIAAGGAGTILPVAAAQGKGTAAGLPAKMSRKGRWPGKSVGGGRRHWSNSRARPFAYLGVDASLGERERPWTEKWIGLTKDAVVTDAI